MCATLLIQLPARAYADKKVQMGNVQLDYQVVLQAYENCFCFYLQST